MMNWIWQGMLPPELELTPRQRSAVLQGAARKAPKSLRVWTLLAILVPIGLGMFVMPQVGLSRSAAGHLPPWILFLLAFLPGPIVGAIVVLMQRRAIRRHLHAALNEIGCRTCATCGYWLKGLDDLQQACPECGTSAGHLK